MIYGELEQYDHPQYDLHANLNRVTSEILLWFAVNGLCDRQKEKFHLDDNTQELLVNLKGVVSNPAVYLMMHDIPTLDGLPAYHDENDLSSCGRDGIVTVNAYYPKVSGHIAVEKCCAIAEEAFSGYMLESSQI